MCFCGICCFIICVFVTIIIINCFYFALCIQTLMYAASQTRVAYEETKRLSQTESPIFVILCVLCFQRQSFLTFISLSELSEITMNTLNKSNPILMIQSDPIYFWWYFSNYSFLRLLISNITVIYLLYRLSIAK